MASFNKVILMGNLTRDPQLKYTPSQVAVCEFGLAINRKWKSATGEQKEEVNFIDITAFGRTGEVINQYFTKGKPIFVEGRLKYDQWDDKTTGAKRSKLTVVAESFEFIGGRDGPGGTGAGGGGSGGGQNYSQEGSDDTGGEPPAPRQQSRPAPAQQRPLASRGPAPARPAQQPDAQPPFSEEPQFKDDDIPF